MNYYSQWQEILNQSGDPAVQEIIQRYYEMEAAAYESILEAGSSQLKGTAAELSAKLGFGEDMVIFAGFLDGINPSLSESLDLESITDDTDLVLTIDFPVLYIKMHEAKADWLYGLKAWDNILPPENQQELTREYRTSKIVRREKTGRNDLCPCGSGKKYKNCCGKGV